MSNNKLYARSGNTYKPQPTRAEQMERMATLFVSKGIRVRRNAIRFERTVRGQRLTTFLRYPHRWINEPLCNGRKDALTPMEVVALCWLGRYIGWLLSIADYRRSDLEDLGSSFGMKAEDLEYWLPKPHADKIRLWFKNKAQFVKIIGFSGGENEYGRAKQLLDKLYRDYLIEDYRWPPKDGTGRVWIDVPADTFRLFLRRYARLPVEYHPTFRSPARFNILMYLSSWFALGHYRITPHPWSLDTFCKAMGIKSTRRNQRVSLIRQIVDQFNKEYRHAVRSRGRDVTAEIEVQFGHGKVSFSRLDNFHRTAVTKQRKDHRTAVTKFHRTAVTTNARKADKQRKIG